MATPTDIQQFAVPDSSEAFRSGFEALSGPAPERSEDPRFDLEDTESTRPAPYIVDAESAVFNAHQEAFNAAQPTKPEVNVYNPEAIYAMGERITGYRKYEVALQDEAFMSAIRSKSINEF